MIRDEPALAREVLAGRVEMRSRRPVRLRAPTVINGYGISSPMDASRHPPTIHRLQRS